MAVLQMRLIDKEGKKHFIDQSYTYHITNDKQRDLLLSLPENIVTETSERKKIEYERALKMLMGDNGNFNYNEGIFYYCGHLANHFYFLEVIRYREMRDNSI